MFSADHKDKYGASFNTQKSTHWWINFFSKYFFPEILAVCYFKHYGDVRNALPHPRQTSWSNWSRVFPITSQELDFS